MGETVGTELCVCSSGSLLYYVRAYRDRVEGSLVLQAHEALDLLWGKHCFEGQEASFGD